MLPKYFYRILPKAQVSELRIENKGGDASAHDSMVCMRRPSDSFAVGI